MKVLKAFELLEQSSTYLKPITQVSGEDTYKVYFPVTLSGKTCKMCHGQKNEINPKVLKLIQKNYPQDKAINYLAGEIRGAVVVTVHTK